MARILDLSGPSAVYATRLLAETGHDVIRVEPVEADAVRRMGPYLGDRTDPEHGAYHAYLNAGKRSVALDLHVEAGQRILLALARRADALIATLPLPVEEADLRAVQPKLVLILMDDGVPEICAYARSGLLALTGHPQQRPTPMGGHVPYTATGLYAGLAAAAALLLAQSGGAMGQTVRLSVLDCLTSLTEQAMVDYTSAGQVTERHGFRGAITAVSGAFPCADGYWMISLPHTPEGWRNFMEWVQDPELAADASLAEEAERAAKKDFVLERLASWSCRFTKAELVAQAQRRHIPASPVANPEELVADEQLLARGFLTSVTHPEFGRINFPVGAIASLTGVRLGPAPRLGEHTAQILAELGYDAAQRGALVRAGVIFESVPP